MTCREKWELMHPGKKFEKNVIGACPWQYGYLDPPEYCGELQSDNCQRCWDREIPGIEETEKEKPMTKTKKTKAELMYEIAELEKQLKDLERYKVLQEGADEIKAMHTAFMNSGFSDHQAFELLKSMLDTMLPAFAKGL